MTSEFAASLPDPLLGTFVGDEFFVTEKLGEGGMGSVYRATQKFTNRSVALKVLHTHLYEPALLHRFIQEAQIVSKLNHPNIITLYKFGQNGDGRLYLAMEYVDGRPLDAVLDEAGPFEVERALPLMIQLAEALAYAHELKIVHRDIKPENILVARTGRSETIRLLDFGIAKALDTTSSLTRTGMVVGSPPYMSPEQWKQVRDLDGRTDLYSLGCVFFEMMSCRQPHRCDNALEYMMAHTTKPVPSLLDVSPTISALPELAAVIVRCLAIHRDDRYADAYALVDALRDAQARFETRRRALSTAPRGAAKAPVPTLAELPAPSRTPSGSPAPLTSTEEPFADELGFWLDERPRPVDAVARTLRDPRTQTPEPGYTQRDSGPLRVATPMPTPPATPLGSALRDADARRTQVTPARTSDHPNRVRTPTPSMVPLERDHVREPSPAEVVSARLHAALVALGSTLLVALGVAVVLVR